ncbi:putative sodium/calcium exchanger 7 [Sabethes cyaneus]|uniref:putative sodium/calcium exchanger 7 n=1 Tax=Sabethes cyaneus TaxID=53552 RepID=UPI00237E7FF3|nr:putative sodium/calcium exchanger 7 [Sabethes cyaneus]
MASLLGNLSVERFARHASYVHRDALEESCNKVHELAPSEMCQFVMRTESCREDVFFFDYTYFLFCTIGYENTTLFRLGTILLVFGLLLCFTVLGTTADEYFCPVLAAISKKLKISETVAGVTILAFGNGSPDLFTAASNPSSDTELMFGELLGAAMFVIGVVGAVILIIRPFQQDPLTLVRDVVFFTFIVGWITVCAYDERFTLSDAVVVVVVYMVYLAAVLLQFFLLKRELSTVASRISLSGEEPDDDLYYNDLRRKTEVFIRSKDLRAGSEVDITKNRVSTFASRQRPSKNRNLFQDFCSHVNPVDQEEWNSSGYLRKTLTILLIPIRSVLCFTIPVVDYTVERHGWTKLLNMIHCLTLPLLFFSIIGYISKNMLDIPVWAWLVGVSFLLMVAIFFTSRTDRPPCYHLAYALLAFFGSILIIYIVAQEVVSLLVTIGLVLNLSRSMLGLSVLAWGNSIGDLFSNITLAKQGYGKMAFAACMGGPLFSKIFYCGC